MFKAQNNISRQTGGKCFVARTLNQNGKKAKKQKLKEQWFLEEEAKNHCELIAALM